MAEPKEKTIPVLRIANWDSNFENAKSRKVNHKSYGQYVLKQGRGYCRLMMEKDGPAIYGTFIAVSAIIQGKPSDTRKGFLTSTGDKTGYPYSFEDMAAVTRIPVKTIKRALSVLVGSSVHWLIGDTMRIPEGYHEDAAVSAQYTGIVLYCTECTESNITFSKPSPTKQKTAYTPTFEKLWKFYPGNGSKKEAFKSFNKSGIEAEEMAAAIQKQIDFRAHLKSIGEFVPNWKNFVTWINQESWDDKTEVPVDPEVAAKLAKQAIEHVTSSRSLGISFENIKKNITGELKELVIAECERMEKL